MRLPPQQKSRWLAGMVLVSSIAIFSACEPPKPPSPPPEQPVTPTVTVPPFLPPHIAAREGALLVLQAHKRHGLDLDARDETGATLLHVAAAKGHLFVVEWLMEQGADVHARDYSNFTPVQVATFMDQITVVEYLLQQGAVLDVPEKIVEEFAPDDEPEDPVPEDDEPAPVVPGEMPAEWKDLEFRQWTSASGRQVEAGFLSVLQDTVMLGSRDGREMRIPINQLSREDQILARQLAATQRPMPTRSGAGFVDATPMRVSSGFSSECERILVRAIQDARQQVLVAIYTLTRPAIEQALSAAARRGVEVKVKYDAKQSPVSNMQELINRMQDRGVILIPISMGGGYASMHHKFAVIDGRQVFTGSYNFTTMASTQNYENCVLIESVAVARDFTREFDRIRGR